jgi:hypothetical protein
MGLVVQSVYRIHDGLELLNSLKKTLVFCRIRLDISVEDGIIHI